MSVNVDFDDYIRRHNGQTDSAEPPIRCGTFSEKEKPDHSLQYVLARITECRLQQDAEWGGPTHDDQHAWYDWLGFIRKQIMRAGALAWDDQSTQRDEYEDTLLKIAALSVAAVQSSRRKRGL